MKYLLAQPAMLRFEWELDVALTNILSLDPKAEIVCLFSVEPYEVENNTVNNIRKRYPQVSVHVYVDMRVDRSYAPTIRPFLWYCYLSEDPSREKDSYLQLDSDVIFREKLDFSKFKKGVWYGSDCGGYIDYDYLRTRRQGEAITDSFADLIGVDRKVIETTPGAGAQWVLYQPTAEYWLKVYNDCSKLHYYLEPLDSEIQKWTAEMWAQLYNIPYFGNKIEISKELDFCRPTDDIKMWSQVKILHNAGVIGELAEHMFFKGKYVNHTPFGDNLAYVRRDKASIKYVDAIQAVNGII